MPMNPRLLRPLARFQAPAGDPFATLVSTKSTGNVSGSARSTTGYIKVEWWDATTDVYGTGVAGNNISWSKAAGGAGEKTIKIYPSDASGNLDGALTSLICSANSLTSLDVSGLTAMTNLTCSANSLTSLDVSLSASKNLTFLNCANNLIASLRAQNRYLEGGWYYSSGSFYGGIVATNNLLTAAALDQLYTDLTASSGPIVVNGNPGTTGDDPSIATNKGYTVYGS